MKHVKLIAISATVLIGSFFVVSAWGEKQDVESLRTKAAKLNKDGNYKEA